MANPSRNPFFSPDGSRIGYFAGTTGMLEAVAVTGGASIQLADAVGTSRGASWGTDDTIIFGARGRGLRRVAATGGAVEVLTTPNTVNRETEHWFPEYLPDQAHVLFTIRHGGRSEDADVAVLDLETGDYDVLIPGATYARYSPSGHIVFTVAGEVRIAAFDLKTLEVRGTPVAIPEDILVQPRTGVANFGISPNGTLVYLAGQTEAQLNTLAWIDRDGHEEPIDVPPQAYIYASLSPDGTRIALDIGYEDRDTWIYDLVRKTLQRLTFDPGDNMGVAWSPDGQRVAFSREIDGHGEVYWQAADGSGVPEPLTRDSAIGMIPHAISGDGSTLFYGTTASDEIWTVPIDGAPAAGTPLIKTPFRESNAVLSPDGQWLAYESNESGRTEIYVRPYPNVDAGRWQVSTVGGARPLWQRDGRELFYLTFDGLMTTVSAVDVEEGSSFRASLPHILFSYRYNPINSGRAIYDVAPDGSRFLVVKAVESQADDEPTRIIVVENWFTELERLAPLE